MLKNNSFDNMILESQIALTESEISVMENVDMLTEAEDSESNGQTDKKGFFTKAKEFFINMAKAIANALKKFMSFFVEAFRKLVARIRDVQKYVKTAKVEIDKDLKLSEGKPYKYFDANKIVDELNGLDPEQVNFKEKSKEIKERIEKGTTTMKIVDIDQAVSTCFKAESYIKANKKSSNLFKIFSKKGDKSSKEGVQAAGKEDKEAVKRNKEKVAAANKMTGLCQKVTSKGISYSNAAISAAYSATKSLRSLQKSNKKAKKKADKNN